jgi:hypothetical protein
MSIWRERLARELELARLQTELEAGIGLVEALRPWGGEDRADAEREAWEEALRHCDERDHPLDYPDEPPD